MGDTFEYVDYVKAPGNTFKPMNRTLKTGLYKDENEVLYWLVHNRAKQKIDYYDKKISEMEKKYKMNFYAFENIIHSRRKEENFEEWNDFILWAGYLKACRYWKQFC